jgi:hypothetical protein
MVRNHLKCDLEIDQQTQDNGNRSFWDEYEDEHYDQNEHTSVDNLLSAYNQPPHGKYLYAPKIVPMYMNDSNGHINVQPYVRQSNTSFENYPYFSGLPTIPSPKTSQLQINDDDASDKQSKKVEYPQYDALKSGASFQPLRFLKQGKGYIKLKVP